MYFLFKMITLNDVTKAVKKNNKKIDINLSINEQYIQQNIIPKCEIEKYVEEKVVEKKKSVNHTDSLESDFMTYKENEIINISDNLSDIIDLNEFYSFGVSYKNSIIHSILYVFDNEFKLNDENTKNNFINQLIINLIENLDDYFKKNEYSKKGLKKARILSNLKKNIIDNSLICYLSDYLQLNVIIIDSQEPFYELYNDYNSSLKSIILIKTKDIYLPLIHLQNKDIDNKLIMNIFSKYKLKSNKVIINDNDLLIDGKLKSLTQYNLAEIHRLCEINKLNITYNTDDNKIKKKTKQILYEELKQLSILKTS